MLNKCPLSPSSPPASLSLLLLYREVSKNSGEGSWGPQYDLRALRVSVSLRRQHGFSHPPSPPAPQTCPHSPPLPRLLPEVSEQSFLLRRTGSRVAGAAGIGSRENEVNSREDENEEASLLPPPCPCSVSSSAH